MEYPNLISVVRSAITIPLLFKMRPEKITFAEIAGLYRTIDPKLKEYNNLLNEDQEFKKQLNAFFNLVSDKCWDFDITDDDDLYNKICIKLLEPYIQDYADPEDEVFLDDYDMIDFNRVKNSVEIPQTIIDMIDKFKGMRLLLEV
nr:MAG TPA: hypothetical protein [Caudoviricetes sp.]